MLPGTIKSERDKHHQMVDERATLTEEILQKISPKRFEHSVAVVRGWLQSPTPSESSFVDGQKACANVKRKLSSVPMNNLISSVKEEAKLFTSHRRAACDLTSLPHVEFGAAPDGTLSLDSMSDVYENTVTIAHKSNCEQATTPRCTKKKFQDMEDDKSPTMDDSGFYNENDEPLYRKINPLERNKSLDKTRMTLCSTQTDKKPSNLASLRPQTEKRPILRILKANNIKISDFVSDSEEETCL
uniref:AKAP-like protein n=1 Tax=Marsilea vestita TaxID=59764 RepID=I6XPF7_MARVE|nr:AKAP-like protein [Marsilea vestita]AFN42816.1 akap-like protein [Marsilea vestita]